MVRLHMEARKRCYNHPHRETELACDRCRTTLCADCLVKHAGQKLCAQCVRELEAAEAAKLTFKQRVVRAARSLLIWLAVFAVLGAVLLGLFYAFRDWFDRPITPEELARFRYALTGSFETEEGVNHNSTVLGATVVSATSAAEGYPPKQLINEYNGPNVPAWRSADATFPQEVVVEFQERALVEKVILVNSQADPPETYAREFEILVSSTSPTEGYESLGRFQLEQHAALQRFEVPPTTGRWIMLRILSNYGSTEYTSLDEFGAYTVPKNPLRPTATP